MSQRMLLEPCSVMGFIQLEYKEIGETIIVLTKEKHGIDMVFKRVGKADVLGYVEQNDDVLDTPNATFVGIMFVEMAKDFFRLIYQDSDITKKDIDLYEVFDRKKEVILSEHPVLLVYDYHACLIAPRGKKGKEAKK